MVYFSFLGWDLYDAYHIFIRAITGQMSMDTYKVTAPIPIPLEKSISYY